MGDKLIAFFVALGAGMWAYNKTMRSTGSNTKNSLTVAGVAGLFAFVIALIIIGLIPN